MSGKEASTVAEAVGRRRPRVSRFKQLGAAATAALALAGCGETEAQPEPSQTPDAGASVVYYQPYVANLSDPQSLEVPAGVYTMVAEPGQPDSWTIGDCQPDNADNFLAAHPDVSTSGGFSVGRVGALYWLSITTPEQQANIENIITIAPGNAADFAGSCDDPARLDSASLLASWLALDPGNRFTIIADQRTAEDNYAGIRTAYLDGLAGAAVASQVNLCFAGAGHEETWNQWKDALANPLATCPPGTAAVSQW